MAESYDNDGIDSEDEQQEAHTSFVPVKVKRQRKKVGSTKKVPAIATMFCPDSTSAALTKSFGDLQCLSGDVFFVVLRMLTLPDLVRLVRNAFNFNLGLVM